MAFTDRSRPAREAILRAARTRFGTDGYDRATVRAIAADAGVDPSMVVRYFGSKRQLFALTADFDLRLPDLREAPRDHAGHVLAEHLLARWEGDDGLMILLRTAVTDDDVAERMRAIFTEQLTPMIAGLAGEGGDVSARAGVVATQALGVALCRYVLRLPPVVDLSPAELVAWIGPTLQRYLVGAI
ncbi:TetR family transcriptional regulator [Saccharomonospora piscinae]|uniref:TetR family transcriptional regulator n=1 Tax=Saccharomonospora piscinae TaxID=687388 RepID=A0A1V8ZYJ9_SACPI|nr:TetR family transcriptional regulator [Saccharomonospora piscinae]OQO89823.1 TetR family transcriptional regulator [Saccharomonospora piscinae]